MNHTTLLQNVRLFDPRSDLHNQLVEILIKDGIIEAMGEGLGMAASELIDGEGAYVSLGWMDSYGFCPDPGEPWKESLISYAEAAQLGGFTHVAALCGTSPKSDNESVIAQVKQVGELQKAHLMPWGLASVQGEGKEMAEVYEMHTAGAVAFTDGIHSSPSLGLRTKLMQYCASLGLKYAHFPFQKTLAPDGKMHEGQVNATLGFKGIPVVSETVELLADIELAKHLGCGICVLGVSSAESVQIIRDAKAAGVSVVAAVPVLNLLLTDESLVQFDENLKVLPPLRSELDRAALLKGLLDGTLTAVVSNHHPEDIESKKVEFDYAAWGAATLQSVFSVMCKAFENERPEHWVPLLYRGSRAFLGMEANTLTVGGSADLTLFHLDGGEEGIAQKQASKAYNVPKLSVRLKGKVTGTIRKGCYMKNHG
jgi:dihydroorotase